jgi:hypothetical protein
MFVEEPLPKYERASESCEVQTPLLGGQETVLPVAFVVKLAFRFPASPIITGLTLGTEVPFPLSVAVRLGGEEFPLGSI